MYKKKKRKKYNIVYYDKRRRDRRCRKIISCDVVIILMLINFVLSQNATLNNDNILKLEFIMYLNNERLHNKKNRKSFLY